MSRLSRRQFVVGAGAAGLGPLMGCTAPLAQPIPVTIPRVGALLRLGSRGPGADAFLRGLQERGYAEGENIVLEWRAHENREDRFPELLADLIQRQPALIYTSGTPTAVAARQATSSIPIVMTAIGDPVALGLVSSLAHPGGNVTGVANLAPQLSGKRLELLKAAIPGLSHAAMLVNAAVADRALDVRETREAARLLSVQVDTVAVRDASEFEAAFTTMQSTGVGGLLVLEDMLFFDPRNREQIAGLAARHALPAMYPLRELVDAGGLMAYGPSFVDAHRRGAYYVDRILKGTKPADLPVEQPMTFDFVVNMKTAQALGITFPNEILLQVTEVIE